MDGCQARNFKQNRKPQLYMHMESDYASRAAEKLVNELKAQPLCEYCSLPVAVQTGLNNMR